MDNEEKRKSTLLLIELACLKPCISEIAHRIARFRDNGPFRLFEDEVETKRNHDAILVSTQDKVGFTMCQKLEEIFSLEELREIVSLHQNPLMQKFIGVVDSGEGEMKKAIEELLLRLEDEIIEEANTKLQMFQISQFNNSNELKN